jgi:hypothetical protein
MRKEPVMTAVNWPGSLTERLILTSLGAINVQAAVAHQDGLADVKRVENVNQDDLAARENPNGVNAEIDAFLATLPGAAAQAQR